MNYSQKVLFDDWISRCPIEGVFVDEPVSEVQMDDGISCIFDQLPDHELVDDCGWVLDKAQIFTKFFNSNSYDTPTTKAIRGHGQRSI